MTDLPITSFTLRDLIHLAGGACRGMMADCIAANSESQLEAFRQPNRIDALIIGVGTQGESTLSMNLHEHKITKDTLFVFAPNNILQVHSDERLKTHALAISTEFLRRVNIDIKAMMPLFMHFAEHPCLSLSEEDCRSLRGFIALIEQELQTPATPHAQDIISALIGATIYKVGDIQSRYLDENPDMTNPLRDRKEIYFRQFIALLGEHYRSERSVGFYAQQLCITPKYLTTLIKRISGKSVSEWIDIYVILEAKTLLRHSDKSIQEIAYALNFPNQSFFGSYFKRNTGQSPSQYKEQHQ